jgi:RNA recognition motif-containing protein
MNNLPKKPDLHFFVGNLSPKTDEDSLRDYFSCFGKLVDVFIARDREGFSRRFGYITFSSFHGRSPLMNHHMIDGR